MGLRITKDKVQEIIDLHGNGLNNKEIARKLGISPASVGLYLKVRKEGFNSQHDYKEHLAKERGYASWMEYQDDLARKRGYNSVGDYWRAKTLMRYRSMNDYRDQFAKHRGFESYKQYRKYLIHKKLKRQEYHELSDLINRRLKELGKTQAGLARELGITRQAVNLYSQGIAIPHREILVRLFGILQTSYKSLGELLNDTGDKGKL